MPNKIKEWKVPDYERRFLPLTEIRADDQAEGKMPKLVGHAAVFNILSEPMYWGFQEQVRPGTFKKTIQESDIRSLFNHDPNIVLGRNKAGTLTLREDDTGLWTETDPPETTAGKDLVISIRRKDITQMSIGFRVVKQEWDETDPEKVIRSITEAILYDISPVTFPMFPETDVGVRSVLDRGGINGAVLSRALGKNTYGVPLSQEEMAAVRSTIEILQGISGPAQEDHPGEPAGAGYQLRILRNRLDLIERST